MAQVYPPENGKGPIEFKRSYVDEATGELIKESNITRDPFYNILRAADDVDEPDHDQFLQRWRLRPEYNPPEP